MFLTPDSTSWDPYDEHFASNKESMLDWEGNMMEQRHRKQHLIEFPSENYDKTVHRAMAAAFFALEINDPFAHALNQKAEVSKFDASIGSTIAQEDDVPSFFLPSLTLMT